MPMDARQTLVVAMVDYGYTADDIGCRVGVHRSLVHRWASGERAVPTSREADVLAVVTWMIEWCGGKRADEPPLRRPNE